MTDHDDRCWFCGDAPNGEFASCQSLKCLTLRDEMLADEINHRERQVRLGVWRSLFEWCSLHGDKLTLLQRVFYTVKLWICCLFGWHRCFGWQDEPIDVAEIYFQKTYAGWDQAWLRVGSGITTNWCYELMTDSEWNM